MITTPRSLLYYRLFGSEWSIGTFLPSRFVAAAKDNFAPLIVGVNAATAGGGSDVFSSSDFSNLLPSMIPKVPGGVVLNIGVIERRGRGRFTGSQLNTLAFGRTSDTLHQNKMWGVRIAT